MTTPNAPGPQRFIDMFGSMPTAERLAFEILSWGSDPGYSGVFRDRWARLQGLPPQVVAEVAALPRSGFEETGPARLAPFLRKTEDVIAELRAAGAAATVLHNPLPTAPGLPNDALAALVARYPNDLIGFARIDPTRPGEAAAEIKRCVTRFGFKGATMTPFWHRIRASDESCRPIYEVCIEHGIPIWIHTSVHWVRSTPLSYEHPLHLDEVAVRFPDLKIVAGHGGWPWIADMVAVAWRHPNVYVDTTAFRPRHIATPGSGWDMLWYFMSRTLEHKVLFGSTWTLLGRKPGEIADEARGLELSDRTRALWLHDNAARVLGLAR